jgi:DNA-binding Lrp family transcriptional regulator
MDLQAQRDLKLLNEVERNGAVTQRTLATQLGVALGLTNLYLKRLARKGYIKISTIPRNRIKYLLTPRGLAEKTRLTYQYMEYSLSYYRDMRYRLKHALLELSSQGSKRIVIYGTGELAELAYLTLQEMNLTLVGFVDGKHEARFLAYPVSPVDELLNWDFDALLIAELEGLDKVFARLAREKVPPQKVITLLPKGTPSFTKG